MYKNQPTSETTAKPSIEAFALPSELRRTHNFASRARPIIGLDLPLTPSTASPNTSTKLNFTHAPTPRRAKSMPETDFLIESRIGDNDTAYGLPASWREPHVEKPKKRRRWSWSERSTAAFSGFAGGLIVVLPLIFLLSTQTTVAPVLDQTERASTFSFASTAGYFQEFWKGAAEKLTPSGAARSADAAGPVPIAEIETRAITALRDGQLDEARRTLRTAASPENPRLWLLLAQSYDPDTSGSMQAATMANDIEFARFYYRQALTYGIEAARPRLEALSPH